MCGIAGFLNFNDCPPQESTVRAMLQPMICRGPDGEGVKTIGPAAFGHRRLSIIDLSGGKPEPYCAADESSPWDYVE